MAKISREIVVSTGGGLMELDEVGDFMSVDAFQQQFVIDENRDIMPPDVTDVEDNEFELDENGDLMPKL